MLDAQLPPQDKIAIAPDLFGGLNTDDPRGELQKSIAKARTDLDPSQASGFDRLGDTLDDVVTSAVRRAFRPAFIVTAALALLAALILLSGALGSDGRPSRNRRPRPPRRWLRLPATASPSPPRTR